jgi:hypothetical protein
VLGSGICAVQPCPATMTVSTDSAKHLDRNFVASLIDVVIQQVLFFANASDVNVQPDVAVNQLELLVSELNSLAPEVRASVRARVADRLRNANGPERQTLAKLESMLE